MLYRVDFSGTMYVVASDEEEAVHVAERAISREGPKTSGLDHIEAKQANPKLVHPDWKDAIPFGEQGDRTVTEILKAEGEGP